MATIKVLELFSGIRATSKAFKELKMEIETTTVEFDADVQKVANELWNTNEPVRDVTKFETKIKYDFLIAGFPCQPFSKMGLNKGIDDERGKLYKDTLRIIEQSKPKNVILENVTSIMNYKHRVIVDDIEEKLGKLGYKINIQRINSKTFIPQNRPRVFISASLENEVKDIIIKKASDLMLGNYLDSEVSEKYIYDYKRIDKDGSKEWIVANGYIGPESARHTGETDGFRRFYKDTHTHKGALLASGGGSGVVVGWKEEYDGYKSDQLRDLFKKNKIQLRKITPSEALRLQGWKESDIKKLTKKFTDSEILHVAGNSMAIPVMKELIKNLIK